MPKERFHQDYAFLKNEQWLTFEEIEKVTRAFVRLGVTKIRLTGGEPLLRPNLPQLITRLKGISGIHEIALTTNGSLLSSQAKALKESGLDRITISLDALNEQVFHQMNGQKRRLEDVLNGIKACNEEGFNCIKINVVLYKGINDHHILDLVRYFRGRKPILRFIEYMDVGNCNEWQAAAVIPSMHVVELINRHFPIVPVKSHKYGEVASRYHFTDGNGEIGFISSISQPFCQTCTRARLSTDGKLYTCLFSSQGTDLKTLLRHHASDTQMTHIIQSVWEKRDDRYSELRSEILAQKTHPRKVEMYQIGG